MALLRSALGWYRAPLWGFFQSVLVFESARGADEFAVAFAAGRVTKFVAGGAQARVAAAAISWRALRVCIGIDGRLRERQFTCDPTNQRVPLLGIGIDSDVHLLDRLYLHEMRQGANNVFEMNEV